MNKAGKLVFLSSIILCLSACHKGESYGCYLLDRSDYFNPDTLEAYSEGIFFKKLKPEEECDEDMRELDSLTNISWLIYECSCGWEPD